MKSLKSKKTGQTKELSFAHLIEGIEAHNNVPAVA